MTSDDCRWLRILIEVEVEDHLEHGETPPQLADEMLAFLRRELATLERTEEYLPALEVANEAERIPAESQQRWLERQLADRERLRRLLDDPDLPRFLVEMEDSFIYGR